MTPGSVFFHIEHRVYIAASQFQGICVLLLCLRTIPETLVKSRFGVLQIGGFIILGDMIASICV